VLRRWREASEALTRATQQDPLSAEAHYHLGFAAAHAGQLSRAEEAWRTFLRLENGDARRANVARRAADAAAELRRVLDAERE
jgi:cytochrome c-type biogenesis protein CcmH/NrfG